MPRPTGPILLHPAEIYIYEKPPYRLSLVLALSSYCSRFNRTVPCDSRQSFLPNLPKRQRVVLMLPRRSQLAVRRRSQRWRKNLACANLPSPVSSSFYFLLRSLAGSYYIRFTFVSIGLLSKFQIRVPKREKPTTQAPEPHRSASFFEGTWETLWTDCELDQGVATPTNATEWSSDEELTPRFCSNFPRTP